METATATPPLAVPSKLGQDKFVDTCCFLEYFCLLERVLTGGGVYNKDAAVRSAGMLAGDDFPDLVELIHQVALGVQTSGGIDKQNIVLIPDGDIHRLPRHGGGSASCPLEWKPEPVRSAQMPSCSTAAARKVSAAARRTFCPAYGRGRPAWRWSWSCLRR